MIKKTTVLLSILLLCSSCQKDYYQVETAIWECLYNAGLKSNIDLKEELRLHELFLVEKGILKTTEANAYIGQLEEIIETDRYLSYNNTDPRWEKALMAMASSEEDINKCLPQLFEHKNKMATKLKNAAELLENEQGLRPRYVAQSMLSSFSKVDYEHPLYRFFHFPLLEDAILKDQGESDSIIAVPPPSHK